MKKFRKISALMLALALICALSASVFAASDSWVEMCGSNEVEMEGTVNRYDASGTMYVNYIYGMSYAKISTTCTYYPMPAGSRAVTHNYSDSDYFYGTSAADAVRDYSISVTPSGCFSMIAVTYNFKMNLERIGTAFESAPYSIEY